MSMRILILSWRLKFIVRCIFDTQVLCSHAKYIGCLYFHKALGKQVKYKKKTKPSEETPTAVASAGNQVAACHFKLSYAVA